MLDTLATARPIREISCQKGERLVTIGTAVVVVFVLYLIDKHKLWRQSAQVIVALVVLTAVAAGGYFSWHAWQNHRAVARAPIDLSAGFIPKAPDPQLPLPPKGFVLEQNFLVQIVRLKYPTQYHDLSDTELGQRILHKYPQCSTLLNLPESPDLHDVSNLPDDMSEICRIYEPSNTNQ